MKRDFMAAQMGTIFVFSRSLGVLTAAQADDTSHCRCVSLENEASPRASRSSSNTGSPTRRILPCFCRRRP